MVSYDVEWYHHLPSHVKEILSRLESEGHKAYVAGGAVRDLWLGLKPKDFDLVSDASPEQIEALFPKTLGVGRAFGIMIVVAPEGQVEIARFRADGEYTDGRHPNQVVFSDPAEDAKRRDFTINALFYDPKNGQVLDYVGGVAHLKAKLIQTVGAPFDRFQEDALRMLRAVRFHAQLAPLGFSLEPGLLAAISSQTDRLSLVSRERITQEVLKIFGAEKPRVGLEDLLIAGLWEEVFQSSSPGENFFQQLEKAEGVFKHTFGRTDSLALYFGAFSFWLPKFFPQKFVLTKEIKAILPLLSNLRNQLPKLNRLAEKKRAFAQAGIEEALSLLSAESPDLATALAAERESLKRAKKLDPSPLLKGSDLVNLGFAPGPAIKTVLDKIRDLQLEEKISEPDEAIAIAQEMKKGGEYA